MTVSAQIKHSSSPSFSASGNGRGVDDLAMCSAFSADVSVGTVAEPILGSGGVTAGGPLLGCLGLTDAPLPLLLPLRLALLRGVDFGPEREVSNSRRRDMLKVLDGGERGK